MSQQSCLTISQSPSNAAIPIVNTDIAMPVSVGTRHKHIWILSGPAGCGKTSLAGYLSQSMSLPYIEGDNVRSLYGSAFRAQADS